MRKECSFPQLGSRTSGPIYKLALSRIFDQWKTHTGCVPSYVYLFIYCHSNKRIIHCSRTLCCSNLDDYRWSRVQGTIRRSNNLLEKSILGPQLQGIKWAYYIPEHHARCVDIFESLEKRRENRFLFSNGIDLLEINRVRILIHYALSLTPSHGSALTKSLLEQAHELFGDALQRTSANKFRSTTDVWSLHLAYQVGLVTHQVRTYLLVAFISGLERFTFHFISSRISL